MTEHKTKGIIDIELCEIDVTVTDKRQPHCWGLWEKPNTMPPSSPSAGVRYLLATETEQEKINWILEIIKLRSIQDIVQTLIPQPNLGYYAAHALANISSGRQGILFARCGPRS